MSVPEGSLGRMIHPRAIAVVGASATPGKVGHEVLTALRHAAVPVVPVHPKAHEVLGIPVVHDVAALPDTIDLAVIATGADVAVAAAGQCADRGIPYVVVLASGFAETGQEGAELEARLRRIVAGSSTRILGPNTLGLQVPATGVDTIFVEHASASVAGGSTVLISQSGSVAVEALLAASRTGFGIRAFVGLGNKSDLAEIDFLDYFADDPDTRCIALYLEDLSAGRALLDKVREISAEKPVIAIKAGRTSAGARAASSHTGRLSGSDRVIDGALAQYRVQRVDNDEALCDAAKALELCVVPNGNRVAVLSPAGGYGVMLADLVETPEKRVSLCMAELSERTRNALRQVLPGFASSRNPVDLTASVRDETYLAALNAVLADPGVDVVVVVFFLAPPGLTGALVEELADVVRRSDKTVVVLAGDEDGTGNVLREFYRLRVAAFPSVSRTATALRSLEHRRLIELADSAPDPVRGEREIPNPEHEQAFDEYAAKQFLSRYGLSFPPSVLIPPAANGGVHAPPDDGELRIPAPGFDGPYAVKVCSTAVQHKTEAGGVLLGIAGADLAGAVARVRSRFPGAAVLVEQMVAHAGVEVIAGAFRDPELGPCVMVGSGGILAEVQQDVAFRLLPCSRADALQMIDELTIAPVFNGYRGLPARSSDLADIVASVNDVVTDLGDSFSELDLNPLVFASGGLVALDAVLVLRQLPIL